MAGRIFFLTVGAVFLAFLEFSESATTDLSSANVPEKNELNDGAVIKGNFSGQCVLPLLPRPDTSIRPEDGIRFGNTPYSRQELSKDPEFMYSIMHDSIFAMEFKTTGENGVMFYVSAGCERIDYIALFMKEGKIVYAFDCGSGSALMTSKSTYNDGKWHRVVFLRHSQEGRMVIDEMEDVRGTTPGYYTRVDQQKSPFYVGGISEGLTGKSKNFLQGISTSFPGCIRNVKAQGELLTRDTQSVLTDTASCSSTVEEGDFFSADGGYLVPYDRYYVGQWTSISLDIKPRHLSGVLMAIHGKQDYLILQLIDGRVEFTIANGNAPVTATYNPSDRNQLCDGQFHTIRIVNSNNIITVAVDEKSSEPGSSLTGRSSIDTFDPLYVGGLPESSWSKSGVRTKDQFVGCMRNLKVNQQPLLMAEAKVFGHATLNTCPAA